MIDGWGISYEIALIWMSLDFTDEVNIGSGNGFVPPGNKLLPEPMLIQFSVAILGNNELSWCCCIPSRIHSYNRPSVTFSKNDVTAKRKQCIIQ